LSKTRKHRKYVAGSGRALGGLCKGSGRAVGRPELTTYLRRLRLLYSDYSINCHDTISTLSLYCQYTLSTLSAHGRILSVYSQHAFSRQSASVRFVLVSSSLWKSLWAWSLKPKTLQTTKKQRHVEQFMHHLSF
jgi:hypothetical protein